MNCRRIAFIRLTKPSGLRLFPTLYFHDLKLPDGSSKNDGGTGPIIRDALDNHTALVDLLLKSGANTKLKDKEGHVAKDLDYHPDTDSEILEKEVKKEAARDGSKEEL